MNADNSQSVESEHDLDLRHCLRDVLILLGCRKDIADLLDKSEDGLICEADVDAARQYAIDLFAATKIRLTNLHKLRITPTAE